MRDNVIERKAFPTGDVIFKQGSNGRTAYIVQKGRVEIVRTLEDETEKALGTVGPGGIFGEMAVIDETPRMASARAVEPTTVIVVTEQMFAQKLEKTDPFIRGLIHVLADTIRAMGKKPEDD